MNVLEHFGHAGIGIASADQAVVRHKPSAGVEQLSARDNLAETHSLHVQRPDGHEPGGVFREKRRRGAALSERVSEGFIPFKRQKRVLRTRTIEQRVPFTGAITDFGPVFDESQSHRPLWPFSTMA